MKYTILLLFLCSGCTINPPYWEQEHEFGYPGMKPVKLNYERGDLEWMKNNQK
jgi:hypothetical protein